MSRGILCPVRSRVAQAWEGRSSEPSIGVYVGVDSGESVKFKGKYKSDAFTGDHRISYLY